MKTNKIGYDDKTFYLWLIFPLSSFANIFFLINLFNPSLYFLSWKSNCFFDAKYYGYRR